MSGIFLEDGGSPWWLNLLTPELVVAILVVLGLLLVLISFALLFVYMKFRRSPRWRRALLVLRARYTAPGPRREAIRLRLRLQSALVRARRAVELARADERDSVGDLSSLLKRSERLAVSLDRQLELLQGDDPDYGRQAIAHVRVRVEQMETAARQIERAAAAELEGAMVGELEQLKADADSELTALQAGVNELARLTGGNDDSSDDVTGTRLRRVRGEPR